MPDAPRTPHRTFRCEPDLWERAKAQAAAEGRTISDVIRDALRRYAE